MQTKLTAATCTDRPSPLCPYCGCKNQGMLGFMHIKKKMELAQAKCTCCRREFQFQPTVIVTFCSAPLGGWEK